jgi:hypothetical protein
MKMEKSGARSPLENRKRPNVAEAPPLLIHILKLILIPSSAALAKLRRPRE